MSGLLKAPAAPSIFTTTPPPPSPTSTDATVAAETQQAMATAQEAERKTKGRASTILTSGTGLDNEELTTSKRYLLGV